MFKTTLKIGAALALLIIMNFNENLKTFAATNGDIALDSKSLRFTKDSFLQGQTTRIYVTAKNKSKQDLLGIIRLYDGDRQIGTDLSVSLLGNQTDTVFLDWTPQSSGEREIKAILVPWKSKIDNPDNNSISHKVTVQKDFDHDGTPDHLDPDDDNDRVPDEKDSFPLNPKEQFDTDGDGVGDNEDQDADNDGVPDEFDDLPLDSTESVDTDKDGIGNSQDADDDGDGLSDLEEEKRKTDPLKKDTDQDGKKDGEDAFPLDPKEQTDTDQDGIGNGKDIDDDNDGTPDSKDKFPLNMSPKIIIPNSNLYARPGVTKIFTAGDSFDPDGNITSYLWEIEGKTFEGNAVKYTFQQKGEYPVKLIITDNYGEKRSSQFLVSVNDTRLYIQLSLTLLAILLALFIYFKYISPVQKS